MSDADAMARARSFGAEVDAYRLGRPTYPPEAIAWALPASARRIADVGAGTGKLTAVLAADGRDVVAVEPDAAMRAALVRDVPGVDALDGRGEQLPLPDASVDAVVYGQAWHWVDVEAASAEAARVLRPHGTLALFWNIRDERVDWIARIGAIVDRSDSEGLFDAGGPSVGDPFPALESHDFPWTARQTPAGVEQMVASRSYVITAESERRSRILEDVRELVATHPDLAGRDEFPMPYVTHAFRARRP